MLLFTCAVWQNLLDGDLPGGMPDEKKKPILSEQFRYSPELYICQLTIRLIFAAFPPGLLHLHLQPAQYPFRRDGGLIEPKARGLVNGVNNGPDSGNHRQFAAAPGRAGFVVVMVRDIDLRNIGKPGDAVLTQVRRIGAVSVQRDGLAEGETDAPGNTAADTHGAGSVIDYGPDIEGGANMPDRNLTVRTVHMNTGTHHTQLIVAVVGYPETHPLVLFQLKVIVIEHPGTGIDQLNKGGEFHILAPEFQRVHIQLPGNHMHVALDGETGLHKTGSP